MSNGIKDLASRADTALDKATNYSDSLAALAVALNPATSTLQDVFDIGLGGINTLRSLFKGEGIPGQEVARSGFGILGLLPIVSGLATRQGRQALSDLMKRLPEEEVEQIIRQLDDPASLSIKALGGVEPKLLPKTSSAKRFSMQGENILPQGYPTSKLPDPEILTDALRKASAKSQDVGLGRRELNPLRGQDEKDDLVKIWLRDDKRKEIETALGWKWLPDGDGFVNLKTGALQKNIPEELLNNPEWRAIRDRFAKDRNKIEEAMEEGRRRGAIDPNEPRYVSPEDQERIAASKKRDEARMKKASTIEMPEISFMTDEAVGRASREVSLPAKTISTLPGEAKPLRIKGKPEEKLTWIESLRANPNLSKEEKIAQWTAKKAEILETEGEKYLKIFEEQGLTPDEWLTEMNIQAQKKLKVSLGETGRERVAQKSREASAKAKKEQFPMTDASENPAAYANKMLNELVDDTIDTASHRGFSLEDIADIERLETVTEQGVKIQLPPKVTVGGIKFTEDLGNPKVVPMNYKDGQRGLNMQPQFKGKSTLDLIKSGDRTGTSRASINKDYKVGDLVEFEGRNKEKILVRIEAHGDGSVWKKVSDIDPEEWMASEGWDLEAYNRLAREGNYQMKYSVAKPGQQGERVFEAEGVTKINDALRRIYEEGYRKDKIETFGGFISDVDDQGRFASKGFKVPKENVVTREGVDYETFLRQFQAKPLEEQKALLKKFMSEEPMRRRSDLGHKGTTKSSLSKQDQLDIDRIKKERADAKADRVKFDQEVAEFRALRERVSTAMKDSYGDRDQAAQALGITRKELDDIIRKIKDTPTSKDRIYPYRTGR